MTVSPYNQLGMKPLAVRVPPDGFSIIQYAPCFVKFCANEFRYLGALSFFKQGLFPRQNIPKIFSLKDPRSDS